MGGWGSTRWNGIPARLTVEGTARFDLADFVLPMPWEEMPAGVVWTMTYFVGRKPVLSVDFTIQREESGQSLVLTYHPKGPDPMVKMPIPMQFTVMPSGGKRWWLTCPVAVNGRYCGRRVRALHLPKGSRYFACRTCYNLTYASIQERDKQEVFYMKHPEAAIQVINSGYTPLFIKAASACLKAEKQEEIAFQRRRKRLQKRAALQKHRRIRSSRHR